MHCPHCSSHKKSYVLDTRRVDNKIYRKRECGNCQSIFVSEEYTNRDMTMPPNTYSKKKFAPEQKEPVFDTTPLDNVWK